MTDPTEQVAEAIRASMEDQCSFEHVGLIEMHLDWRKVAQAAIDALLPEGFVGFIVQGEDKIKRRVYTDADAEAWVDRA